MQAMLVEKYREKARSEVACAPAAVNFKIWACKQISQMAHDAAESTRGSIIITSPNPKSRSLYRLSSSGPFCLHWR